MYLKGFDYEQFKDNKFVVNCRTQEEAEEFLDFLRDIYGCVAADGTSTQSLLSRWVEEGETTCYRYCKYGSISFGSADCYRNAFGIENVLVYGTDIIPQDITISNDDLFDILNVQQVI